MTVGSSKASGKWITAVDGLRAVALKGLLIHLETTSMSDYVTDRIIKPHHMPNIENIQVSTVILPVIMT